MWNMIVEETNLYALQEMMPNWHTLTSSELKAYIGMLILMSILNLPQVYLYWSSDKFFNVQEVSNVMSFRRFQQITRCLHLNDNSKIPDKTSPDFDRSNKKDLPPEVKLDNKLQRGAFLYRSKGPVSVYQWRDSKNVHVMSNYHDPEDETTVERKLPCGKKIRVFAVLAAQTCSISSFFSGNSLSNGRASALGGPRQITAEKMGATVVLYFVEYQTKCVSKETTTFQSHPTREEDAARAQPSAPRCFCEVILKN
ncbi:hypothetical protein HPB50_027710 [Hyalomma asiaticum]|nr:hypothetical protein HPB50_027710 [Hyalomma asiaticum]